MTTYLYNCDKCDQLHSREFRFGKARKWIKCPDCNGRAQRSFISAALNFVGDSWETRKGAREADDRRVARMKEDCIKKKGQKTR